MLRARLSSPVTPPRRVPEILDLGHLVCIDTYCYGGGWLTVLDAYTRQVWQVDQEGKPRLARNHWLCFHG
jgi:hypothetical protein